MSIYLLLCSKAEYDFYRISKCREQSVNALIHIVCKSTKNILNKREI